MRSSIFGVIHLPALYTDRGAALLLRRTDGRTRSFIAVAITTPRAGSAAAAAVDWIFATHLDRVLFLIAALALSHSLCSIN